MCQPARYVSCLAQQRSMCMLEVYRGAERFNAMGASDVLRCCILLGSCFVTIALGCGGESPGAHSETVEGNSTSQHPPQDTPTPTNARDAQEAHKSNPPVAEQAHAELVETPYFTLRLPPGWHVEQRLAEEQDATDADFSVTDPGNSEVFAVTVATDEPRFIQCFCAPWENYRQYERDGIQYADLTMYVSSASIRTLKAKGDKYGTDVHLMYEHHDRKLLDTIIESIQPY